MTTYGGGTRVRSGYYLDAKSFTFVNVEKDGGTLPGGWETRYLHVPVMAVMAAAPALGGLFVVALPFIGIGMAAYAMARKLGAGARAGATEIAATLATPAAVPGEAHLTGGPAGGEAEPAAREAGSAPGAPVDAQADALQKDIESQRGTIH
jgi:hypothetical protein